MSTILGKYNLLKALIARARLYVERRGNCNYHAKNTLFWVRPAVVAKDLIQFNFFAGSLAMFASLSIFHGVGSGAMIEVMVLSAGLSGTLMAHALIQQMRLEGRAQDCRLANGARPDERDVKRTIDRVTSSARRPA